jgi:Aldehyde oxidase and xanthine dehydrogenase, a/b hammerhead domain
MHTQSATPTSRTISSQPVCQVLREDRVGTPSQCFRIIRRRTPKVDAIEKATGRAQLGANMPLPCLLVGKILCSPSAHARIQHIDTGRATARSGVRATITGQDLPTSKPGTPGPTGSITVNEYYLVRLGTGVLSIDDTVVPKPFATAMEGLDLLQQECKPAYGFFLVLLIWTDGNIRMPQGIRLWHKGGPSKYASSLGLPNYARHRLRGRIRYFSTVDLVTSMPTFRSSPQSGASPTSDSPATCLG